MQKIHAKVKSLLPEYNKYLKEFKNLQAKLLEDTWEVELNPIDKYYIEKFTKTYLTTMFKGKPALGIRFMVCAWLKNDIHYYFDHGTYRTIFEVICKPSNEPELDMWCFLRQIEAWVEFGKYLDCNKQVPELIWEMFSLLYDKTELYKKIAPHTELSNFNKGLVLIPLSNFMNWGVRRHFNIKELGPFFTCKDYLAFNFEIASGELQLLQLNLWKKLKYESGTDWQMEVSEEHLIKLVFPNFVSPPKKKNDEASYLEPEEENERENENNPTGFTVIRPEEMDDVALFYDADIQQFVDRIDKILGKCNDEKLKQICGHMLFYGDSGAGKTALAYYLAKKHGYKILKVEASEITSKYVGEDMKNVNTCFKAYANMLKTEKVILLFNEVETLMTTRSMANNTAAQHYNAFMSEFLIKMEEFRGIAMYTANNVNNFDDAIFRRFLFAKKFTSPGPETRKKQWKTFVGPWNTDEGLLADLAAYPLSGAQIKLVMDKHDLINLGEETMDMDLLWQLLEEEVAMTHIKSKKMTQGKQIGFALGHKQAA